MKHVLTVGFIVFLGAALLGSPSPPRAQETTERQQLETDAALDAAIADLEAAIPSSTPQAGGPALLQQRPRRAPHLRLIDVSLDVLLFAGFSSENDDSISTLQGGGHDPKTRGYTLGQTELSLSGVVDPYLHRRSPYPVRHQPQQRRNDLRAGGSLPGHHRAAVGPAA